jgi:uncharacterized protein YprB with RNaseH-like and TPR domain
MSKKPNIIFFDIETTPIKAFTWSMYPKALSYENIDEDWSIICAAWKSSNESKVNFTSVSSTRPKDDYKVVKTLRDALAKADILVGHNLDKFDVKKLNARLVYHRLPPLPLIPTVDTLKQARKIASFTSNRLDYLALYLTGKGKLEAKYSLWKEVLAKSKPSLDYMVKYCKQDVVRLIDVYTVLRPYMTTHPHVGAMAGHDRGCSCPKCGSSRTKMNGVRVTASGLKKQEIQCLDCGSYHRTAIKPS